MAVIKNKKILKCLLMMVVSLLLILNFSIEVSASTNYDRQEVDACITISQRLSVKGGSDVNPNALKYNGDGTWTSNEGLIYGQSQDGNRVIHVLKHTTPDPSKPLHTVYNVDKSSVIGLVDEAWTKRGNGIMQGNGNVIYDIDMGRVIGTNNESVIRIITRGYTNEIITAFPKGVN